MKIVKHIPNTITCMNLISGTGSIIFAFQGDFMAAFILMLLAAVFDFMDGLAERTLHAYSDIGKELDSLCDAVSFGLAPSLILFTYLSEYSTLPAWVAYSTFFIAALSAVRLAKFNLDTRQSKSFIGLPTPANGLFIGALVAFAASHCEPLHLVLTTTWITPILCIALALLLVSEVPMFSLKSITKGHYFFFGLAIITIAAAVILAIHFSGIISLIFAEYILWNTISSFFTRR